MSLKTDIENIYYSFNALAGEYREEGTVNEQTLNRLGSELERLKKDYTDEEADLDILTVLSKKQKVKKLRADQLPNEVYWYLNQKKFFTLNELAALVGITREALRGRVQRGTPTVSKQTAIGKTAVEGGEIDPVAASEESFQYLFGLRAQCKDTRTRLELEKEIQKQAERVLDKQLIELRKELKEGIEWIVDVLIPDINKANRAVIRDIKDRIKEDRDIEQINVDIRPLFKRAIEDGVFKKQVMS